MHKLNPIYDSGYNAFDEFINKGNRLSHYIAVCFLLLGVACIMLFPLINSLNFSHDGAIYIPDTLSVPNDETVEISELDIIYWNNNNDKQPSNHNTSPAITAPTTHTQSSNVPTINLDNTTPEPTDNTTASNTVTTNTDKAKKTPSPIPDGVQQSPNKPALLFSDGANSLTQTLAVKRGDHLAKLLVRGGVQVTDANIAAYNIDKIYSLRALKVGQKITFSRYKKGRLLNIRMPISALNQISYKLDSANKPQVNIEEIPTKTIYKAYNATIKTSFIAASLDAGINRKTMNNIIQLFSYDIDFQRDVHKNDTFSVMVETHYDTQENTFVAEHIIMASLVNKGVKHVYYSYVDDDNHRNFYDEKGASTRKGLLRTPIDGARLSSGYGYRKHPILGYTRAHRGLDFAAPRGTPIYAAGDGVVEYIGNNGAYGKYIRIRHGRTFKTAYAHLHKYAKGLKNGSMVKQRDVIGYVGSTGLSTGPHLHYEIIKNGVKVNPQKVKLPSGKNLSKDQLKTFKAHIQHIHQRHEQLLNQD